VQDTSAGIRYRVAKTHRMPYLSIFRKRALQLVAFLRKMTCNLRYHMSLCHPVSYVSSPPCILCVCGTLYSMRVRHSVDVVYCLSKDSFEEHSVQRSYCRLSYHMTCLKRAKCRDTLTYVCAPPCRYGILSVLFICGMSFVLLS